MRRWFTRLDDILIERVFQPVSDAMSYRIGLSRSSSACFCADAASIGWILSQARALSDSVLVWDGATAAPRLGLLLLGLAILVGLRGIFLQMPAGSTNSLRVTMQPHRAVVLLMLAARLVLMSRVDLAGFAEMAMLGFAAAALYFGACTARPRLRRRATAMQFGLW